MDLRLFHLAVKEGATTEPSLKEGYEGGIVLKGKKNSSRRLRSSGSSCRHRGIKEQLQL